MQFFTRNLNMLLVLKFERLIVNYHEKMLSFAKMQKKYLICIFTKIGSGSYKFITRMISAKNSTNPESFNGFRRGCRIDWRNPWIYPSVIPLTLKKLPC